MASLPLAAQALRLIDAETYSAEVESGDKVLPATIACRQERCATCVFRPEKEGGIILSAARRAEICGNLIDGANQLCHHDKDKTICRGGRDYQLELWARLGRIAAPTDEALAEAMAAHGITPAAHVSDPARRAVRRRRAHKKGAGQ